MKELARQYRLVLMAVLLPVLFSGCAAADGLRRADDKVGKMFDEFGIETDMPANGTSTRLKLPDINFRKIGQSALNLKDRLFGGAATSSAEATATSTFDKAKMDAAMVDAKDLTREAKDAIDAWLTLNGYNRYGDPITTYYTGGTPLFNEMTGEAIDRFEYILEKHPEIFKVIND